MQNTEKGTQTHKNTIEKINAVCKQYNKTLLDENATLDLQRLKYEELTTAIQQTTAEKIKAKYTEQAMQELVQSQTDALDKLKENAEDATYKEIQEVMETTPEGVTVMMNKVVDVASSSIRGASGAVWDAVESMAVESANQLKGLTGQAYTDAFNNSLNSIVSQVKQSTSATDKEMDAFKSNIKTYLESIVQSAKKGG